MHLKCKMTQAHVDRGEPNKYDSCPVALSMADAIAEAAFTETIEVSVCYRHVAFHRRDNAVKTTLLDFVPLSQQLIDFIQAFDANRELENPKPKPAPIGEFEVYMPEPKAA